MKNNNHNKIIIVVLLLINSFFSYGQISPARLQAFIEDDKNLSHTQVTFSKSIKSFYSQLHYNAAWVQKENATQLTTLLSILNDAANFGLQQSDYQFKFIQNYLKEKTITDSLEDELRFTDAALHFFNDIAYGNTQPVLSYEGLKFNTDCKDIVTQMANFYLKNNLTQLINNLMPSLPEINLLLKKINFFQLQLKNNNFKEVVIKSNIANAQNIPLIEKLFQLGIVSSNKEILLPNILKEKIKQAQKQFNLLADGTIRSTLITELNIPLSVRLQQMILALNYYRWLNCITQNQKVIVVNIPAAYLKVYSANKVILEMRLVVGKTSTPTPTLTSKVDEVVLYPYWHVPYKIATKELLPSIKRNPKVIDQGNYQVLNAAGKIINPYSINWHSLSANNFPYTIRQSTGCDNALGLIKLNFYNPFDVYLHDTPGKLAFSLGKRYLSHGCMRMEKPMELGHLVLSNNGIAIDTLEQKGCLRNQSPTIVKADVHMPVIVWYNPVGIDNSGMVLFYEDIYKKFNWAK